VRHFRQTSRMKSLTFKIVIPLTIISLATLTKWWYALPVDAPDTMFTGFPFPFVCDGWHTSLSLQIFVTEFIADLLTYFLFWFIVIFSINRFAVKLKVDKAITIGLWTLSGLIMAFATLLASNKDNLFYVKRPFKMEVMETGFQFGWEHKERPDFYKYHPEVRQQ
jgi:prepilin signal peptidase PulO-like enzyme (type II secretory pathway)